MTDCLSQNVYFYRQLFDAKIVSWCSDCIKEVVVKDVGESCVVQIVTDNGSNYKKACKQLIAEYPHITWQPCAAHTINLMLKYIARCNEVDELLYSAKRICRFLYKHNK